MRLRFFTNGKISSAQLHRAANLTQTGRFNLIERQESVRRVWEYLRQQQFYSAKIDSVIVRFDSRSKSREQALYFDLGSQFELEVSANSTGSTHAVREWQRELRGHHEEQKWPERLYNVLDDFARAGHPLAAFSFDSVQVYQPTGQESARALLHFTLDPGPLVHIDSIIVRGNRVTKPYVLLRELPIRAGDRFDFDKVQSIPEKLLRLGFIQAVAPPELRVDRAGRHLLEVNATEGNNNWLNGVAGYNPGSGTQKGYLTGLIDLQFGNLLGTGRLVNARWEKRGPETQELGLRYREPWVAGFPVHLSGGFQQLIQDTLYVERKWDLMIELPLAQRFTLLGRLGRENVSPDSLAAMRYNLPASQVTEISGGLRFDSRDDLINPRSGFFYFTSVATGRKNVSLPEGTSTFSRKRLFMDLQWLIPTAWPQVLSLALHGRQVTSSEPEVSITDLIRFGGATTLRGYREEQFLGSRVAWSNLEYRYLLSHWSRAFVFVDAGYYFRESSSPAEGASSGQTVTSEEVKYSYGLGVRMDTPLGLVGVDYAIGEGDELLNGKVHVSLINNF